MKYHIKAWSWLYMIIGGIVLSAMLSGCFQHVAREVIDNGQDISKASVNYKRKTIEVEYK